jgi:hypothetical protein
MRRGASIGITLLALSHLAFVNVSSALAQAGGTVGKQDKSVSGGTGLATAPPPSPKPDLHTDLCKRLPGVWSTSVNSNLGALIIKSDGTMTHGSFSGTWTCDIGVFNANWYGTTTKCTISRNARQFSCASGGIANRQN